jgi:hypothetical protein
MLTQGALHGQGGVAGSQGVILMRQGGAEQGHDAVTQHLVDGALEAVHSVHHGVQGRVQQLLGGFRVEIFNECGRVGDISKQHGDLFAFAF